ncbi:MAG: ORF6N domain-containing protein [Candidatus Margulisiibacteriota bacterium]|jgi:hypothetical protein
MGKLLKVAEIKTLIIELRGQRVILDTDIAMLYGVSTRRLMEQVKRNLERFPSDFMFQLSREEWKVWKSQFATSGKISSQKKKLPFVFTRNGANMLSAILHSPVAIKRSIQIMKAFSALEQVMACDRGSVIQSPEILEKLSIHSSAIMHLFQIDKLQTKEINTAKQIISEMIEMLKKIIFKLPDA